MGRSGQLQLESLVSTKEIRGELQDIMMDDDWALIFGDDGMLKGIFIPKGRDEEDVPQPIQDLLKLFNIDIEDAEENTIH